MRLSRYVDVASLLDDEERTRPAAEYVAEYDAGGSPWSTNYFDAHDGAGSRNHDEARLLAPWGWRMRTTVARLLVVVARESVPA
jgi:hypothetical protein